MNNKSITNRYANIIYYPTNVCILLFELFESYIQILYNRFYCKYYLEFTINIFMKISLIFLNIVFILYTS